MACNPFICTILLSLSESSKVIVLKDFILEKIKIKVTEKSKKNQFSATMASILDDSDRLSRIVQMNGLHAIFNVRAL